MIKKLGGFYLQFGMVIWMMIGLPWYLAAILWVLSLFGYMVFSPVETVKLPDELKKTKELDPNGSEYLSRFMPKN